MGALRNFNFDELSYFHVVKVRGDLMKNHIMVLSRVTSRASDSMSRFYREAF